MTARATGPVLVMGAGAIGCYVGGLLQAAGTEVHFVGRPQVLDALRTHGLTLTDLTGRRTSIGASFLNLHTEVPGPPPPALVLLTVKSGATKQAALDLQRRLPARTLVVSMQNGISNMSVAQQNAPNLTVRAGMVPYNVAALAPGQYHRGTSGTLAIQDDPALRPWVKVFRHAGLRLRLHADMRAVQWGKLLLNLNNPVNALSGLPLKRQLLDRRLRRITAALVEEGLQVLAAAGIRPERVTPVPPAWVPALLRLPTLLFRLAAASSLRIDAQARSSMADDLAAGRPTEIHALCGEVVAMAREAGVHAPLNARMVHLVETWPKHPEPLDGTRMHVALGLA